MSQKSTDTENTLTMKTKSVTINTLCPKIGMYQWTCTYEECNCHLREQIVDKANKAFDGKGNKLWVKPKNKTIDEVKKQIREEDCSKP